MLLCFLHTQQTSRLRVAGQKFFEIFFSGILLFLENTYFALLYFLEVFVLVHVCSTFYLYV